MTRIWNPYTFTPLGNPIVGEAPPVLRVMGGMQATAQQLSYAQQRFTQFVMQARLSVVPNPTEAGRLPDGTQYRIVKVGPQTVMEIWPGRLTEVAAALFSGVVRMCGDEGVGAERRHKEFKQNKGPGNDPPEYRLSALLYSVPPAPTGVQLPLESDPVWQIFRRTDLSGPAAKLAQFGRGACAAYRGYFRRAGVSPDGRSMGDGMVVLREPGGGKKRVFCYSFSPTGALLSVEAKIAKESEMGMKLPADLKALFDGAPVPPSAAQWASAQTLVTTDRLRTITSVPAGEPLSVAVNGIGFPGIASTAEGVEAYAAYEFMDPRALPPENYVRTGGLIKFAFSLAGGGIAAAATAQDAGIIGYHIPLPQNLPMDTHTGAVGVTHVGGELTIFRRVTTIRDYARDVNAAGTAPVYVPTLMRVEVTWSGGAAGSVTTYVETEYQTIEGSSSYSGAWAKISERMETYTTPEYYGVITVETFYETWAHTQQISASRTIVEKPDPNRGDVRGLMVEGMFHVYRAEVSEYSFQMTGGATYTLEDEYFCGSITYYGVDGEYGISYDRVPYQPHADTPGSEQIVWYADGAYTIVKSGSLPFGDSSLLDCGYDPQTDEYVWGPDAPWVTNYTFDVVNRIQEYVSDVIVADTQTLEVDGLGVLREFEIDAYIEQMTDPEGSGLLGRSPIYAIRSPDGFADVYPLIGRRSHLGGAQAIVKLYAYSRRHGEFRSWAATKGTLVETEIDRNYNSLFDVTFVGVLQP